MGREKSIPWTHYQAAPLHQVILKQIPDIVSFHPHVCQYVSLLLLLSRFSRVRLCATPQTAAHQAPPSLGFSRQQYWSGLPFSSPVHEK